ncbi:MAG: nitroreductase [Porticoccaceae bacterium]|nr:nitroreductase [Porticoccaceae bacterium]
MTDQIETTENNSLITLIAERQSFPRLKEPGPTEHELKTVLQASMRAPDHMRLRPWRFLIIQKDGLIALGNLFVKHTLASNPNSSDEVLYKAKHKAFRAPVILVGIASIKEHPKVPHAEQILSAGSVLTNVGLALYAIGLGSVWRTGDYAYSDIVRSGLGISKNEEIIGFVYMGTPVSKNRPKTHVSHEDHTAYWP